MATARKKPSSTLLTLKIELVDTTPLIWRRIVISGHASFAMLHHVIQAAMGRYVEVYIATQCGHSASRLLNGR